MPDFHYQALNAEGKLVDGQLQAGDVRQAVAQLEADGLIVQSIGVASAELQSNSVRVTPDGHAATKGSPADAVGSFDMAIEQDVLRLHMGRVLEQGEALIPALRAYSDEMPPGRRRRQLLEIVRVFERGDITEATAAFGRLPDYWIPLLSAATSSRDPGRVLQEFLEESQHADEFRRQWWLTVAYPVFVLGTAGIVMTTLSFLVIPLYGEMFTEFGLELPRLTQLVLAVGDWIVSGGVVIVIAVLLMAGVLLPNVHRLLPSSLSARLSSPFASLFGRRTAIARFARFIADLLEAGLDIPAALRIAGFASRRPTLRGAAWRMAHELTGGGGSGQTSGRNPLTAAVLHALHTDMPNSSKVRLLREISTCHSERGSMSLSWAHGIVEPVTVILVGFIVGSIVLALFLPLIQLISGLS